MVQNIFRLYYQNPAVEVFMVFGTLAIHVGSSILRFQKRYQSTAFSTAFSASSSSSSTNVKKIRSKPVEPTESSSLNNVNSTETNGSNKLYDAEDEKKLRDCGPSFANLSFERQMHRLTGYILSLLVFGHLFVVRICPLIADKTIDMTFLTARFGSFFSFSFPFLLLYSF